LLALSISGMGKRRPKDSGGATHHYKTCKKIMSKTTSKQIFLYSMMTTLMTCERKNKDNYQFTYRRGLSVYSLRARLSPYL
jgi:hypothetical protein